MKCANCGAELILGSVYCAACGREAMIVPDYNPEEEELEVNIVKDMEPGDDRNVVPAPNNEKTPEKKPKKKKLSKKNIAALIAIILVVILIVGVIVVRNANSYEVQYEKAYSSYEHKNYDKAQKSIDKCIKIDAKRTESYVLLAKVLYAQKDVDGAFEALDEALKINPGCEDAIKTKIKICEENGDYDTIMKMMDKASDDILKSCFSDYVIETPVTYNDDIEIKFDKIAGCSIYYTTDGSDPRAFGIEYDGYNGIKLTGGETLIKAVSKDKRGVYSKVVDLNYNISYEAIDMPSVSPDGGKFTEQTYVTVDVPSGCTAYYTWGNTTPNDSSTKYSGPIAVPEGNNVLSVIIVDAHGLYSGVFRGNYVYMP